jgi:phosphomannomutase/phosphoglucomutase
MCATGTVTAQTGLKQDEHETASALNGAKAPITSTDLPQAMKEPKMINEEIFREYDIRGLAQTDLDEETAGLLGRAMGTFFKRKKCKIVTLGHDGRLSSPRLSKSIQKSLISCGLDVWDISLVPTPMSYFSVNSLAVDGGVMITASHNPAEYNGFKISVGKSTIYGQDLQEIKNLALHPDLLIQESDSKGTYRQVNLREAYILKVMESIKHPLNLKIVIDSGNGMAGMIAPELFRRLGCEVIELFSEVDGTFPNHPADPSDAENMKDLVLAVKAHKVLAGVAFDGDADRIGVVDQTGRLIYGDELLVIYEREVLKKFPGAKIISEVKSSDRLYRDISAHGGHPIQWKTGHSLIKAKMKQEGALLAGEMSGHMFFADRYYGYDDALYAAARLFEILAQTGKTPAELIADLPPSFTTAEIRTDCPDATKFQIVDHARAEFERLGLKVNSIDGARVEFSDGWGLVRASNTQPALVYRFEAQTPQRLAEIRKLIESVVKVAMTKTPLTSENGQFVAKPWGSELIWAKTPKYVGKVLVIKAGQSLSLQYHNKKEETLFLESGEVNLQAGVDLKSLETVDFQINKAFHVAPGTIHRLTAIKDSRVFEVSTPELEDVVRIQDMYGRSAE